MVTNHSFKILVSLALIEIKNMTAVGSAGRFYSLCRSAVYKHGLRLWIAIYFLSYYTIVFLVMRSLLLALVVVRNVENVVVMASAKLLCVCIICCLNNRGERVLKMISFSIG